MGLIDPFGSVPASTSAQLNCTQVGPSRCASLAAEGNFSDPQILGRLWGKWQDYWATKLLPGHPSEPLINQGVHGQPSVS